MENALKVKPKIFIVEDNDEYRSKMVKHLNEKKYFNISEFNSADAFMQEISQEPSIVFLNFHMRGLNGIRLLRQIRSYNKNMHVVLLSDREKVQIAINAFVYGVSDYVTKGQGDLQRMTFIIRQMTNRQNMNLDLVRMKRKQKVMVAAIACLTLSIGLITWLKPW